MQAGCGYVCILSLVFLIGCRLILKLTEAPWKILETLELLFLLLQSMSVLLQFRFYAFEYLTVAFGFGFLFNYFYTLTQRKRIRERDMCLYCVVLLFSRISALCHSHHRCSPCASHSRALCFCPRWRRGYSSCPHPVQHLGERAQAQKYTR